MADLFGEEEEDEVLAEHDEEEDEDEEEDILDMDGGETQLPEDVLLMRFCPHDSSMLYPQVGQKLYLFVVVNSVVLVQSELTCFYR
jgi:hypothetical protein